MFGVVLASHLTYVGDALHYTSATPRNMETLLFIEVLISAFYFVRKISHSCRRDSKYLRPSLFQNCFFLSKVVELQVEIITFCIQHFQGISWCLKKSFSGKSFSNVLSKAPLDFKSVLAKQGY